MASSFESVSSEIVATASKESISQIKTVLYSPATIDHLPWEQFEEGEKAKSVLLPLIKNGSQTYIANVSTKLFVATVGSHIFPITVNEKEYGNSYIASNYYVVAMMEEWLAKFHPLVKHLAKPLTWTFGGILKAIKINKIVLLNNWLFTSNILPELKEEELKALLKAMRDQFPAHAFMWRNLENFHGEKIHSQLKEEGFRLMKTRTLYFYNPEWKKEHSSKVHYHHRRDLRLIEKEKYEVVRNKDLHEDDLPRICELYQKVYMEKHTSFSPDFTPAFLRNAIDCNSLNFTGLRKNGRLDGIMGTFCRGNTMICSLFGYETELPPALGLYRMMTVLLLKESEERGFVLNDGSGGESTKKFRGQRPFLEYVGIYDCHLPLWRRLFFAMMEKVVNHVIPFVKK